MAQARRPSATLFAFEVGVLGYSIPGVVHDLLGLVSPEVLSVIHASGSISALQQFRPDYIVITDENEYLPTGVLHQSRASQERYDPFEALRRSFGDRYVAYARRDAMRIVGWEMGWRPPIRVQSVSARLMPEGIMLESHAINSAVEYDVSPRVRVDPEDLFCLTLPGQ